MRKKNGIKATSSTFLCYSNNQVKIDKNNQKNMISTGVVRNIRIFSQKSTLSNSPIATPNIKYNF